MARQGFAIPNVKITKPFSFVIVVTMNWILSAFADEAAESADDQITALREAGISHLDPRNIDHYNISVLPVDRADAIRSKLDAAGIHVNMLGSPIGKTDVTDDLDPDLERLRHLGHLAPILGCRGIRIFSYYNGHSLPIGRWQDESLQRLARLRDLAGELGLVLYHENERDIFVDGCERMLLLADQLRDRETFRLIFDFDNFNACDEDAWENWQQLKDVVDAFHLKDSDHDGQHVPVGQGTGSVRRILADALDRGWEGSLSLEPHLKHSPAVLATRVGGHENRAYADRSARECFQIGADAARALIDEIRAT